MGPGATPDLLLQPARNGVAVSLVDFTRVWIEKQEGIVNEAAGVPLPMLMSLKL